jgi:hypothetical protein
MRFKHHNPPDVLLWPLPSLQAVYKLEHKARQLEPDNRRPTNIPPARARQQQ